MFCACDGGRDRGVDLNDVDVPAREESPTAKTEIPINIGGVEGDGHFEKLRKKDAAYAGRLAAMGLTDPEREWTAYALSKSFRFQKDGQAWKLWGDQLYTCQVVTSALVPVLVGILSTFDDKTTFAVLQITAIVFSIVGTICKGAFLTSTPTPTPTLSICVCPRTVTPTPPGSHRGRLQLPPARPSPDPIFPGHERLVQRFLRPLRSHI